MRNARNGMIYVVRVGDFDLYKIGITFGNVSHRIKTLQTGCPWPLSIVKVYGGQSLASEANLHRALGSLRFRGEFFEIDEDLVARIFT